MSRTGSFRSSDNAGFLELSRSGVYYDPRKPTEEDLLLMRAIDEQYLKTPFYGRRRMTIALRIQGFFSRTKRVRSAMQKMGLEAIYPKPNLSTQIGNTKSSRIC